MVYKTGMLLQHLIYKIANLSIPGCKRWEYSVSLQQSRALDPFVGYKFNLEASFYGYFLL